MIHSLRARLAASSIFTSAVGKVQRWGRAIEFSELTTRPAFRLGANTAHCRPPRVADLCRAGGALAYLAAWDAHRAKLFGRYERKNGIVAFERLVAQVLGQEPYRSAGRVFLLADNGSSQRGRRAAAQCRANQPSVPPQQVPLQPPGRWRGAGQKP